MADTEPHGLLYWIGAGLAHRQVSVDGSLFCRTGLSWVPFFPVCCIPEVSCLLSIVALTFTSLSSPGSDYEEYPRLSSRWLLRYSC